MNYARLWCSCQWSWLPCSRCNIPEQRRPCCTSSGGIETEQRPIRSSELLSCWIPGFSIHAFTASILQGHYGHRYRRLCIREFSRCLPELQPCRSCGGSWVDHQHFDCPGEAHDPFASLTPGNILASVALNPEVDLQILISRRKSLLFLELRSTRIYITPLKYCLIKGTKILLIYVGLLFQGRTDPGQITGLVFQDCSVVGSPDYVALFNANRNAHQAFLGRPWKTFSRTIFIRTYIDQIIDPTGWLQWNGNFALSTLFDAEFGSYGPGAKSLKGRVQWSSQLSTPQAQAFSVNNFIQGQTWLPQTGIPFSP